MIGLSRIKVTVPRNVSLMVGFPKSVPWAVGSFREPS